MDKPLCEENVISDQMAEIMRSKTPLEKLEMVDQMWCFARTLIEATLRRDHPGWTTEQINREIATRMSHGAI